jgi:hypothetical protein
VRKVKEKSAPIHAKGMNAAAKNVAMNESTTNFLCNSSSFVVAAIARAQDYVKTFMRANALLNGRTKVTKSDPYVYGLVHSMFLNSMGEMGIENRILATLKGNPQDSDNQRTEKSGLHEGPISSNRILQAKGML